VAQPETAEEFVDPAHGTCVHHADAGFVDIAAHVELAVAVVLLEVELHVAVVHPLRELLLVQSVLLHVGEREFLHLLLVGGFFPLLLLLRGHQLRIHIGSRVQHVFGLSYGVVFVLDDFNVEFVIFGLDDVSGSLVE